MIAGSALPPRAARAPSSPAKLVRPLLVLMIAAMALGGITACGKRPGDVLPPESVEDNDPFPRSYPNS